MPTNLVPHAAPADTYAAACSRFADQTQWQAANLSPACRGRLVVHGERRRRSAVLVHGYSNCPAQFAVLARALHRLGYNVLAAPLPRHGLADRLSDAAGGLTAEELAAYADITVDIAAGLGELVTVVGMSAGAVVAGWSAHHRPEVERAVLVVPGFGLYAVPAPLTPLAASVLSRLRGVFLWWDPRVRAELGPLHAYPRFALDGLGQVLRLSCELAAAAAAGPPAARQITLVVNARDKAVSRDRALHMARLWERFAPGRVHTFEFPGNLGLAHDLMDPEHPAARPDLVVADLLDLITDETEGP